LKIRKKKKKKRGKENANKNKKHALRSTQNFEKTRTKQVFKASRPQGPLSPPPGDGGG